MHHIFRWNNHITMCYNTRRRGKLTENGNLVSKKTNILICCFLALAFASFSPHQFGVWWQCAEFGRGAIKHNSTKIFTPQGSVPSALRKDPFRSLKLKAYFSQNDTQRLCALCVLYDSNQTARKPYLLQLLRHGIDELAGLRIEG